MNLPTENGEEPLFVIPSFLRHLFLPAIKELKAQGSLQPIFVPVPKQEDINEVEKDLKRWLGKQWNEYVSVVQVPFLEGKFDGVEIMNAIRRMGGDHKVILVGKKEFWGNMEEMMRKLTVYMLSIDFLKGFQMDTWIENFLKNSGMTEEMRLKTKSWVHPSDLIEKITSLNDQIRSFSIQQ